MQIGIFDSLRIFINPLGFFVRVDKNEKNGKYGYSFCRELANGNIKTIARSLPFTAETDVAINAAESMLKAIYIHGERTYLKEGTYMYNHYNILRPRRVLTESEVLNKPWIDELIFNLRVDVAVSIMPHPLGTLKNALNVISTPPTVSVENFDMFSKNSSENESRVDA